MKRLVSMAIIATIASSISSYKVLATTYSDISNHWAKAQVARWSDYGVIRGSEGLFRPNDSITRGEMAVIIDKVMGYQIKAENVFNDLGQAFYTDSILKANHIGVINGSYNQVRPKDKITREEASVLMCKAFGLEESTVSNSNFADSSSISSWAKNYVNALSNKNYITGRGGTKNNFDPKGNITRSEAVTMIDNIVKGFYSQPGTYSNNVVGMVIVNTPNTTLKNMDIMGDLIISEGVASGDLTLDSVRVSGKVTVKGGGENSIKVIGTSDIDKIDILKADGNVRVVISDTANAKLVNVNDGSKDVYITGKVPNLQINSTDNKILGVNANIENLSISSKQATVGFDKTSKSSKVTIEPSSTNTLLKIAGEATTVDIRGAGANFTSDKDSKIQNIYTQETATNTKLNISGQVVATDIKGAGIAFTTNQGSRMDTIRADESSSNSKFDISGEAGSINVSGSNSSIVTQKYSDVTDINILKPATNSDVNLSGTAKKVNLGAENTKLTTAVNSKVESVTVSEPASSSNIYAQGEITDINVYAPKTQISVNGKVNKIAAENTATEMKVYAEKDSNITTISTQAQRTEISGNGKVETAQISADNAKVNTVGTTIKVATGINGTTAGGQNVWGGTTGTTNPNGGATIPTNNSGYDDMNKQNAPTGLWATAPTSSANNDGRIIGTTQRMQYRLANNDTYINCTDNETVGLIPGLYYVRYRERDGYYPGEKAAITVGEYISPSSSQVTTLTIVDTKFNNVRDINEVNKRVSVLEGSTKDELLAGIRATDKSKQTYEFYTYYNNATATGTKYTGNGSLKNVILVVTAENKNVRQSYMIDTVAKSGVVDLALINNKKVTAVDNNTLKITILSNATKAEIESEIRATDRSRQIYNFYTASNQPHSGIGSMDGSTLIVTPENQNGQKIYTIGVPVQKTITVGAQKSKLTSQTAGSTNFDVATKNIAENQAVTAKEIDNKGNIKVTQGLSFKATNIKDNIATLTATITAQVAEGSYYFILDTDGITSPVYIVVVDKANPIDKSLAIEAQTEKLTSQTAGSTKFNVVTTNIADNQVVTVTETDINGTYKSTTGLNLTASKTAGNSATVTASITNQVAQGNYYFRVTIDGITSSIATLTVDKAVVIERSISLGTQVGDLTGGLSGISSFAVTTKNIDDNQILEVVEIDVNGAVKSPTRGLSFIADKVKDNTSQIRASVTNEIKGGTYYFIVKSNGAVSSVATLKVAGAVTIDKTIAITAQLGELIGKTEGTTAFNIITKNIQDGKVVTLTETDNVGTPKSTTGLTLSATQIKNNSSIVTVSTTGEITEGSYYFKATVDDITSSISTIRVSKAPELIPVPISALSIIDANNLRVITADTSGRTISADDFIVISNIGAITNITLTKESVTAYKLSWPIPLADGQTITVDGKGNLSGSHTMAYNVKNEVVLDKGSLGKADDSKITGLVSGKKYKVTIENKAYITDINGLITATEFKGSGEGNAIALGENKTEITGLINGAVYKIEELATNIVIKAVAGETTGTIKITAEEKEAVQLKYKQIPLTSSVVTPLNANAGDTLPTDWETMTPIKTKEQTEDIKAASGDIIVVYGADKNNKVVSFGTVSINQDIIKK